MSEEKFSDFVKRQNAKRSTVGKIGDRVITLVFLPLLLLFTIFACIYGR